MDPQTFNLDTQEETLFIMWSLWHKTLYKHLATEKEEGQMGMCS